MKIDRDKLRNDLQNDSYGAFFGGGFGGAILEAEDIGRASDHELINIALRKGVDLQKYMVDEPEYEDD